MKPADIAATIDTLSTDRLNSYKSYFNLTTDEECLGVYLWNDALSAAFFKLVSIFEVAFRNTLHRELSRTYSNHMGQGNVFDNDWYEYLISNSILNPKSTQIIQECTHIRSRRGSATGFIRKSPQPTPGKVVADQTIGFWIRLIETTRRQIPWSAIFFEGFKDHFARHATYWNRNSIDDLLDRLNQVKELRNRIAHHEPLWKFTQIKHFRTKAIIYESATTPAESIQRMQNLNNHICTLLGWLSKDRRDDYENSYYKRHFDWFCQESTIEIYKKLNQEDSLPLSRAKRELRKILKTKSMIEINHRNGAIVISRDF